LNLNLFFYGIYELVIYFIELYFIEHFNNLIFGKFIYFNLFIDKNFKEL
jgi:hypothetical protein